MNYVCWIYIWTVQPRNGTPKHSETETFHSNWKNKTPTGTELTTSCLEIGQCLREKRSQLSYAETIIWEGSGWPVRFDESSFCVIILFMGRLRIINLFYNSLSGCRGASFLFCWLSRFGREVSNNAVTGLLQYESARQQQRTGEEEWLEGEFVKLKERCRL